MRRVIFVRNACRYGGSYVCRYGLRGDRAPKLRRRQGLQGRSHSCGSRGRRLQPGHESRPRDCQQARRHRAGGNVSCLRGNGDGTFDPPKQQDITVSAWAIEQANFNGDEFRDVVVTDPDSSPPSVNILLGNGDCTFDDGDSEASGGTGGFDPFDLAVANFDHATGPDVAVTNRGVEQRPYLQERRHRRPKRGLTRSTPAPTLAPPA